MSTPSCLAPPESFPLCQLHCSVQASARRSNMACTASTSPSQTAACRSGLRNAFHCDHVGRSKFRTKKVSENPKSAYFQRSHPGFEDVSAIPFASEVSSCPSSYELSFVLILYPLVYSQSIPKMKISISNVMLFSVYPSWYYQVPVMVFHL